MSEAAGGRPAALGALIARLRGQSGLAAHLADDEARLLAQLRARAVELGLARTGGADGGLDALLARLADEPAEFARLESSYSPPETWLFRYPDSVEFVRTFARAFERRAASRPLRALVVGAGGWCEPCSIAAALADALGSSTRFAVEAIDRNPEVFAAPARFSGMHLRGGVPAWAERWFRREGEALVPLPALLAAVSARVDDAERAAHGSDERHDLVLFRNVAIYLDEARRTRLIAALAARLAPEGAMLVGHSEVSLAAQATGLVPSEAAGSFALVQAVPRSASAPSGAARPTPAVEMRLPRVPDQRSAQSARSAPGRSASADGAVAPSASARPSDDSPARHRAEPAAGPADPARYLALAQQMLAEGDFAGAESALGRALYLDRRHEASLVLAAQLAERRGAADEAARLRERAMRIHLAHEESRERDSGTQPPSAGESGKDAPRA